MVLDKSLDHQKWHVGLQNNHIFVYVICLFSLIYLVIHIPWKLLR